MSTIRVPITNRKKQVVTYAEVDEVDAWCLDYRWAFRGRGYAAAYIDGVRTYMHRAILGLAPEDAWLGEHEDRNRLNNCRSNLRLATEVLNAQNTTAHRGNPRPRGVAFDRRRHVFTARCTLEGRAHWLGSFSTAEEAGKAASAFRAKHMPFSPDARAAAS